jgi:orotate phosphoribosyltransferase
MIYYGQELAKAGLAINAIKLNPEKPFLWASGYHMPIYNDNRMFLFFPEYRKLILEGFKEIIKKGNIKFDIIAGTSTAGIPHGALLADRLNVPFIYIRDKPKAHGLKNQIEGIDAESDLKRKSVIVIEDLISTGGSSARAVQAVRDANGIVDYCISIFNYGLDKAASAFNKLDIPCRIISILTYDVLLKSAKEIGYMSASQIELLEDWKNNPFDWGEKHGFPKVEK